MGLDERPGDPFQRHGSGTWPVSRRSGGTPTTTGTTSSRMSSAWTTTSDSECCGSPATRSGSRAHLAQPLRAILLAFGFEWGIALHGMYAAQDRETTEAG